MNLLKLNIRTIDLYFKFKICNITRNDMHKLDTDML